MINKNTISKLNPCRDRFDNFVTHYGTKSYTPAQFLGLRNITHQDKLWVAFRTLSKTNLRLAAADIAESVLHLYEAKCPGDLRPRRAIEAARSGNVSEIRAAADADAARAAARAAYAYAAAAAYAAAYAAGAADADADAAYAAAAYAAAYAAAAYAAAAAAAAAYAAAGSGNKKKQEKIIRTIILKYWNKENK
jgi:hypothetical protein